MTREWKPGDVALRVSAVLGTEYVAVRVAQCQGASLGHLHHWHFVDPDIPQVQCGSDSSSAEYRPIVVIDPENSIAVRALADAFCTQRWDHISPDSTECDPLTFSSMQAALRSLIEPPRPEEPTGLGAVAQAGGRGALVRITPGGEPGRWLNTKLPDEVLPWDGISTPLVVLWEGLPS